MYNGTNLLVGDRRMKRVTLFLATILIVYAVYFDLSKGTLTFVNAGNEHIYKEPFAEKEVDFFEKRVQSGETLLSIVEAYLGGPLPVSVETVIKDFQKLNNGLHPQNIQVGKIYKFPAYRSG